MAPPSPLAIATSSLLRLIKEEASYHKELQQQEARIRKLETQDKSLDEDEGNVEFLLRQEVHTLPISTAERLLSLSSLADIYIFIYA
jgi:tubulin-specific chaperone A